MPKLDEIRQTLSTHRAVMLYFSATSCSVCHALRPKLFSAIDNAFPDMLIQSIDITHDADTAAAFHVFSIPTVVIFLEGREYLRQSRYMSVDEVIQKIARPYNLLYS